MIIFWIILSTMTLVAAYFAVNPFIKNRVLALILFLLIPLSSASIYLMSTNLPQFKRYMAIQKNVREAKADIKRYGQPKRLIQNLEMRVKRAPSDAKAWYFLGQLYFNSGETQKAEKAFKQAEKLKALKQ